MSKGAQKLKLFKSWFKIHIRRNYGPKCKDFVWSCAVCHANFVSDILQDFVEEEISLEKWENKTSKRK